ncbi:MAG: transporter [Variovorax sp.]
MSFSKKRSAIVFIAAIAAFQSASALEVTAGDYEVYPANVNILPLYYQHAERSAFYVNGDKVQSNFSLKSDIGLVRYIRPVELSPSVFLDPQVILPFGQLRGGKDASFLGKASGTADLILGAPVKFLLDPTTRDAFSIGTFVYLPSGDYDSSKPLNLGENRWKALLQLAYVKHFGPDWALDVVGDVLVHGKNDDASPLGGTRKQDPRYETQAHLRYNLSPATALSVGYGYYWGGETKLNGVEQNDKLKTHYARLTATHFVNQTLQVQVQLGKDLAVENGFKEKARLNLRVTKIF